MDTKILSAFFDDEKLSDLDALGLLSLLWLMIRSPNSAGWVKLPSRRTFEFESRCPWDALQRACDALGRNIVQHERGIWLRRFIGHQIGVGHTMVSNTMAARVLKDAAHLPIPIREELLNEYPELRLHRDFAKLIQSPSYVHGMDGRGEERRGEEHSEGKSAEKGNVSDQAHEIVRAYCRMDAPAECHALVIAELARGQDASDMLSKVKQCSAFIEKHAPGGRHNAKVKAAKGFFTDRQWNDPLVFQHRWEEAEKKKNGGFSAAIPKRNPIDIEPPWDWPAVLRTVIERDGLVVGDVDALSWRAVPGDVRESVLKLHEETEKV